MQAPSCFARAPGQGGGKCRNRKVSPDDPCSDYYLGCRELHDEYKQDCFGNKCKGSYTLAQNRARLEQARSCARGRERYTTQCVHPRCRDKGHREAIALARNSVSNCDRIVSAQEAAQPKPAPPPSSSHIAASARAPLPDCARTPCPQPRPLTSSTFFQVYGYKHTKTLYSPLFDGFVFGSRAVQHRGKRVMVRGKQLLGTVMVATTEGTTQLEVYYDADGFALLPSNISDMWYPVWSTRPGRDAVQFWDEVVNR